MGNTSSSFQDKYFISEWGFLNDPGQNIVGLPNGFEEYNQLVELISDQNGENFRNAVDALEVGLPQRYYAKKVANLTTNEMIRVYHTFTFIVQKYTKCLENKLDTIPYEIGIPWYFCAERLGLPCVMTYAATILYNCKLDKNGELSSIYSISGTNDELHFYKVHIRLEKTCNELIVALKKYIKQPNLRNGMELCTTTESTILKVTRILETMYEECAPEVFWNQVRLYLSGFNENAGFPNGLKIKGTDMSFKFGGGSAAQSSLIQLIDIILGIIHESEHGSRFLLDQRKYMPKMHRDFLTDMEKFFSDNSLKQMATTNELLKTNFNNAVKKMTTFRNAHTKLVHKYIVRFITGNDPSEEQGVGGLMFSELAIYTRDTERAHILEIQMPRNNNWHDWQLWLCLFCLTCFFAYLVTLLSY